MAISSSVSSRSPSASAAISAVIRSSAGRMSTAGEVAAEEGREVARRGVGGVLDGAVAAGLIHRDHRVRPGEELVGHRLGHPEQARDHHDRQTLGEGREKVEFLRVESVDQTVRKRRDLGAEAGDAA